MYSSSSSITCMVTALLVEVEHFDRSSPEWEQKIWPPLSTLRAVGAAPECDFITNTVGLSEYVFRFAEKEPLLSCILRSIARLSFFNRPVCCLACRFFCKASSSLWSSLALANTACQSIFSPFRFPTGLKGMPGSCFSSSRRTSCPFDRRSPSSSFSPVVDGSSCHSCLCFDEEQSSFDRRVIKVGILKAGLPCRRRDGRGRRDNPLPVPRPCRQTVSLAVLRVSRWWECPCQRYWFPFINHGKFLLFFWQKREPRCHVLDADAHCCYYRNSSWIFHPLAIFDENCAFRATRDQQASHFCTPAHNQRLTTSQCSLGLLEHAFSRLTFKIIYQRTSAFPLPRQTQNSHHLYRFSSTSTSLWHPSSPVKS